MRQFVNWRDSGINSDVDLSVLKMLEDARGRQHAYSVVNVNKNRVVHNPNMLVFLPGA